MPAWISHSMKVLLSILLFIFSTAVLTAGLLFAFLTGWTFLKGAGAAVLLVFWLITFGVLSRRLYHYLFHPPGEDQ